MMSFLEDGYAAVVGWRNRQWDSGRRPRVHVTLPVVSVGNLSVGGTGKTPVTALVVDMLKDLGRSPVIVARGYGRRHRGLVVIQPYQADGMDPDVTGDEPLELARRCGVPVVVARRKVDAAIHAAAEHLGDVIVVDDGFQHRDLVRELDIVIIDAATINTQRLLPKGRLREPLANVSRAHVVLLHGDVEASRIDHVRSQDALVLHVQFTTTVPPFNGTAIAVCGLGAPQRFYNGLAEAGTSILGQTSFADHHRYLARDVDAIIRQANTLGASAVLTTEKDVVKLRVWQQRFDAARIQLVVCGVSASLEGDVLAVLHKMQDRLQA
jgi:tetraacyldisaccharide 4'-kinase